MPKKLDEKIADAICELNCWKTPGTLRRAFKRELTEEEVRIAMRALEAFVPHSKWIKTWHKQDRG